MEQQSRSNAMTNQQSPSPFSTPSVADSVESNSETVRGLGIDANDQDAPAIDKDAHDDTVMHNVEVVCQVLLLRVSCIFEKTRFDTLVVLYQT